jgi:two-component system, LuxR family, response regulator FixJ
MPTSAVIHLIDDDDGVRKSLAFSLSTAGLAVRAYVSGTAFLEALPGLQPGCIISDIRMPGIDGLELQRRLKELAINLPVIILTGHADVRLAVEAMKAGAVDFIEKPFDDDVLLSAIRVALDRYDRTGRNEAQVGEIRAKLESLSSREREVLDGLLAGLPNKTIAFDLKLSARTVEVHRANVMTKMGAGSLSELVRMALVVELLSAG